MAASASGIAARIASCAFWQNASSVQSLRATPMTGQLQQAVLLEVVQRGEQLALGQVAGRAEQHQRVGGRLLVRRSLLLLRRLLGAHLVMTAELRAHRRQHLVRRRRRGHASRSGRTARTTAPARARPRRWPRAASSAFAAVADAALERVELRIGDQRRRRQVEQPAGHHAAAPPHLGDRGEVEVVLVVLRMGQRRGLGVLGVALAADVRPWPAR